MRGVRLSLVVAGGALLALASPEASGGSQPPALSTCEVQLVATIKVHPATSRTDGTAQQSPPQPFVIPAVIPVTSGSTDQGQATLSFQPPNAKLVTCSYELHQNQTSSSFVFSKCSNGAAAGSAQAATAFTLHIQGVDQGKGTVDPVQLTAKLDAPDGDACAGTNKCFQNYACQSGACAGSNPVVCSALDQCHQVGQCQPSTGICTNPNKPDGTSCAGTNKCMQVYACESGTCTGSDPVVCQAQGQCFVTGTCDPSSGACSNPTAPNGTACNDGNACTQTDQCSSGSCVGSTPIVCTAQSQCTIAGSCNPSSGTCSNPPAPNGTACTGGTCENGSCASSNANPPSWPAGATLTAAPTGNTTASLSWTAAIDPVGVTAYEIIDNGNVITNVAGTSTTYVLTGLSTGQTYSLQVQAKNAASAFTTNGPSTTLAAQVTVPPPPNPPEHDLTVATSMAEEARFLYTGSNPLQKGVTASMDPQRIAVLRGRVIDTQGFALSGVAVTIADHPEYGFTITRADGGYDLAVNGGGSMTLSLRAAGLRPAQRTMQVPWQNFVPVPDVALVALDPVATLVDLSGNAPAQVARASTVMDSDGVRQTTMLLQAGTTAQMTMPDGTTQALSSVHVRATEISVGPNGRAAMPALLPPTTGYTYAVSLTVDEAEQAGATKVAFSSPVAIYLENYLNFFVGVRIPAGYYDEVKHQWIASHDGRVIQVLSTGSSATIDVDGLGQSATSAELTALGITSDELARIALLYMPGQTLWRVPVSHFSLWDFNTGYGPNCGVALCLPPPKPPPPPPDPTDPCEKEGCIVSLETQVLGERVPVAGTPFSLNYRSNRTFGSTQYHTLTIPLTGPTPPSSLVGVNLEVDVAGQQFTQSFGPQASQTYVFTWDGKDAYGRIDQGAHLATVNIDYIYPGVPLAPSANPLTIDPSYDQSFGHYTYYGAPASINTNRQITLSYKWTALLGAYTALSAGLGGWSLSEHHVYDPIGRTLHYGDGRTRPADSLPLIAELVAPIPRGHNLAVAPDGTVFVTNDCTVQHVALDGTISNFAGTGYCGFSGDGGPAAQAQISSPAAIALGPDGSLYIADSFYNRRIRRVDPTGIISTIAGTGTDGVTQDGIPALSAQLSRVDSLAVASDGTVYAYELIDFSNYCNAPLSQLLRISTDGLVRNVLAGQCGVNSAPSDVPLSQAYLHGLNDTEFGVALDGSIYLSDGPPTYASIRRIDSAGIFSTVVGGISYYDSVHCPYPSAQSGVPATSTCLDPGPMTLASDGSLVFADSHYYVVRIVRPNGIITTLASNGGGGPQCHFVSGGLATQQCIQVKDLAVAPDSSILMVALVEQGMSLIRVKPPIIGALATGFTIADETGNKVFLFDGNGRHLKTVDSHTRAVLYSFAYDSAGRLASITDMNDDITSVGRDVNGNPASIVAPFGQATKLAVDSNGYLASIQDPVGDTYSYSYASNGLLQTTTKPNGGSYSYTYDASGRLVANVEPDGGKATLSSAATSNGVLVTHTSAMGVVSTYQIDDLPSGDVQRTITGPNGLATGFVRGHGGTNSLSSPDGTTTTTTLTADPRFGMQAPYDSARVVSMPSGLTSNTTTMRAATLSNKLDLFSLQTETTSTTINGNTWTTVYDASQNTQTVTSPVGRQTVTMLDYASRPVQIAVPNLNPLVTTYDAHGRIASVSQATRVWTYGYDGQGYLASITDPLSYTTSFANDAIGRVTLTGLPDGRTIGSSYDADSNLSSLTLPRGEIHGFGYTPVDLTSSYNPPILGVGSWSTQYAFDLDRRPTTESRPGAVMLSSSYDSAGRLASLVYPQGTLTFTYDPKTGHLASALAPSGETLSYAYDGFLRTGVTWSGPVAGSLSLGFDNNFRMTLQSVNGSALLFGYDADGLMTQAGGLALTLDAHNGLLSGTSLGAVTDAYAYDANGQLASYTASYTGSPIYSEIINSRDALERITQRTETVQASTHVWGYSYDATGRLTDVTLDGNFRSHYAYDADDNRTTYTNTSTTTNATYDAQDRLVTYGSAAYAFTPNGELSSKTDSTGATSYAYSAFGELLSVTKPDGTIIQYVHDAEHRRIGKSINGTLVKAWLYDGALKIVAELDGAMNLVSRFVQAGGANGAEYMIKGGTTYRLVRNHLGSVRLVVNANAGTIAQEIDYDEFGGVTKDTSPGFQPFGFAGGLYDPDTGMVRFGARDYDAQTGRWTSKDPVRFDGGMNLYGYVLSDPVNRTDDAGLLPYISCPDPGAPCTAKCAQSNIYCTPTAPHPMGKASEGVGILVACGKAGFGVSLCVYNYKTEQCTIGPFSPFNFCLPLPPEPPKPPPPKPNTCQ